MPGGLSRTDSNRCFSTHSPGRNDFRDNDTFGGQIAQEMPTLTPQYGPPVKTPPLSPRPLPGPSHLLGGMMHTLPRENGSSISAAAPRPEKVADVHHKISDSLCALGKHLEDVGRTLSFYASAESDARNGTQVLPPGTLRAVQYALTSLVPGEATLQSDDFIHTFSKPRHAGETLQQWPREEKLQLPTLPSHGMYTSSVPRPIRPSDWMRPLPAGIQGTFLQHPVAQSRENRRSTATTAIASAQVGSFAEDIIGEPGVKPEDPSHHRRVSISSASEAGDRDSVRGSLLNLERGSLLDPLAVVNQRTLRSRYRDVKMRRSRAAEKTQRPSIGPAITESQSIVPKNACARLTDDLAVSVVIVTNAIVLGLSCDIEWNGWQSFEYFFTSFFIMELVWKLREHGFHTFFLGCDWTWNWFDFTLVIIAIVDTSFVIATSASEGDGDNAMGQLTIVKVIKLARLGRLARMLRFKMFKELTTMITGVCSGLRVLVWAVVLLFVLIYILGIVLRQLIDTDDPSLNQQLTKAFASLPAAMNTLFMCFTDGCVASNGTPIPVHFYDEYGYFFNVFYMLTVLFVTIGVFNLIMAIFVDNVLERGRQTKMEQRATNKVRLEHRLRHIVRKFCKQSGAGFKDGSFKLQNSSTSGFHSWHLHPTDILDHFRSFYNMLMGKHEDKGRYDPAEDALLKIDREMFFVLLTERAMEQTLEQLEIETSSPDEIFDILDADMSGELDFNEMIAGLMALRGPAEKKDAIGALLCIRASQVYLREMEADIKCEMTNLMDEVKNMHQMQSFIVDGMKLLLAPGPCQS